MVLLQHTLSMCIYTSIQALCVRVCVLIYTVSDVLRKRVTKSYHLKTEAGLFENSLLLQPASVGGFNLCAGKPQKTTEEREKKKKNRQRGEVE